MKGKLISFLILATCAVRSDETGNNNYVIEMPEEDATMQKETFTKPFNVYWNVPTMQCKSKRIPFENLYDKYGIIQNQDDSFRGDKIAILYDPGLFPALLKNETSGKLMFRNGGVPQEGDLEKHLEEFRNVLNHSVPDPDFDGVGIIDFESWRPIFRQNFGVLTPYKDISYDVERKKHWWWVTEWVKAEAKARFEEAARTFMQTSLSIAKQMRPSALWGYYGFPYCFNGNVGKNMEHCADGVPEENDRTYWLWSESTALYPSVYSPSSLDTNQLASLIRGRVQESARVARKNSPILPYFWFRYRDGGYLSQKDLRQALQTMYRSNATGFIIWGSSNDVNTVEKCNNLLDYVQKTFGPAIAKYTKSKSKVDDEIPDDVNNGTDISSTVTPIIDATTTQELVSNDPNEATTVNINKRTTSIIQEQESNEELTKIFGEDIVKYVEDEFFTKKGHEFTLDGMNTENILKNANETILLNFIAKTLSDIKKETNNRQSEGDGDKTNGIKQDISIPTEFVTSTVLNEVQTTNDVQQVRETISYSDVGTKSPLINILGKITTEGPVNEEPLINILGKITTEGPVDEEIFTTASTEGYPQSVGSSSTLNYNWIQEVLFEDETNDSDNKYSSTTNINDGTETESTQADYTGSSQIRVMSRHNRQYVIDETTREASTIEINDSSDFPSTTEVLNDSTKLLTVDNSNYKKEYDLKVEENQSNKYFTNSISTTEAVTSKMSKYAKAKQTNKYEDLTNETMDKKAIDNDATSMGLTATTDQVNIYKSFQDFA